MLVAYQRSNVTSFSLTEKDCPLLDVIRSGLIAKATTAWRCPALSVEADEFPWVNEVDTALISKFM